MKDRLARLQRDALFLLLVLGLIGGRRPSELLDCLPDTDWRIDYAQVITRFGIPSGVVVASKRRI